MLRPVSDPSPSSPPQGSDLGPLAVLAGLWEGNDGEDVAPSPAREPRTNLFRERARFEPMSAVHNHEQRLFGLRYAMTAWPRGASEPFHEEIGYWLWDPQAKQVMRCFMVPRGVTLIAGGEVEPGASRFVLQAEAGSGSYGILSNRFLEGAFKSVRYRLEIVVHSADRFSYEAEVLLQIPGRPGLFSHTDRNTLTRVAPAG